MHFTPQELENFGIRFRNNKEKSEFDFHWNCGELTYKSPQTNCKISILLTPNLLPIFNKKNHFLFPSTNIS